MVAMGSYSSITGSISSSASAAYTLGQGLSRTIGGDARKVHFIQSGKTVLQFDAVVSETHSQAAAPTVFPLENGSSISDHIIVTPFELSITGVISDSSTASTNTLIKEGITSAANLVAGPLGVLVSAAAQGNSSLLAQLGTTSPSAAAYSTLLRLVSGDVAAAVVPAPFDVVTSLRRYPNMVLTSLQVPRDATTGTSLVFNMSLLQLLLVTPQQANIQIFKNAAVSAHKADLGEQEASQLATKYKQGVNLADSVSGAPKTYVDTP